MTFDDFNRTAPERLPLAQLLKKTNKAAAIGISTTTACASFSVTGLQKTRIFRENGFQGVASLWRY